VHSGARLLPGIGYGAQRNVGSVGGRADPGAHNLARVARRGGRLKACDLWKRGTQTVFGEGSGKARVMFVGEQGEKRHTEQARFVEDLKKDCYRVALTSQAAPLAQMLVYGLDR